METYGLIRTGEPFRLRHALIPFACLIIMAYFAYHAVQGRHGFMAWLELNKEIAQLEGEQTRLSETRLRLERRVALLRPESLDPDLLDERARALLGLSHRDELTIFRAPD